MVARITTLADAVTILSRCSVLPEVAQTLLDIIRVMKTEGLLTKDQVMLILGNPNKLTSVFQHELINMIYDLENNAQDLSFDLAAIFATGKIESVTLQEKLSSGIINTQDALIALQGGDIDIFVQGSLIEMIDEIAAQNDEPCRQYAKIALENIYLGENVVNKLNLIAKIQGSSVLLKIA